MGRTWVELTVNGGLEVLVGRWLEGINLMGGRSGFGPAWLTFNAQAGVRYGIRVRECGFTGFTLWLKGTAMLEGPVLRELSRYPAGSVQFCFDALIGTTNIIEASSDVKTWSAISTNLTDCYPYPFTTPPSSAPPGFYRVRLIR